MLRRVTELLLELLVGAALGISCIYLSHRHRLSLSAMLIPRLLLGFLLAGMAHEAGHALAAALVGFRIRGFALWPVRLYRGETSWRLGWLRARGPHGFVAVNPVGTERVRLRQLIVVAAGPLTSLLAAIGSWIALGATAAQPRWIADQLLLVTLWSMLFAAGGVLPIGSGESASDGARLRQILSEPRASQP